MRRYQLFAALAALGLAGACGPTNDSSGGGNGDGGAGHHDGPAPQQDGSGYDWDAPPYVPPDGGTGTVVIYAHTDTTLFKVDPSASPITLTQIGTFDCVGGSGQPSAMTDIAVDKDGNLYGISEVAVYPLQITGSTVHCSATWSLPSGSKFYGMSFAPANVLQANEMLVAANSAGELWAIDSSGATTQAGTFGTVPANDGHGHSYPSGNVGKAWELSGDIVFLANNEMPVGFATVRDCPSPPSSSNCNTVDTLVEIDLNKLKLHNTSSVTMSVRGQVVKASGCTDTSTTQGYGSMYGIAAWEAKVYGFSRAGNLVEISNVDGTACLVQSYTSDKFAGAAVTTVAPVIAPPG